MNKASYFIAAKLKEREQSGLLRKLSSTEVPFDFCSNDYLGLGRSGELKTFIENEIETIGGIRNGAGGSRLLSGNHQITEETEQFVANFHHAEAGLIYNSGYDANVGLLSSLPQRGDTIITDELIHASLIDGARLSYAERYKFRHNDLNDLEQKLRLAKGIIYVLIESVYSMDGDLAPLKEILELCKRFAANLIVDEAHATGIFGKKGSGLVNELGLENDVFARIVTFGKAVGVHGAIILGSKDLRNYLINFSRSFIYTTAAPLHQIIAVKCAYKFLLERDLQSEITAKISLFTDFAESIAGLSTSSSTIQTMLFGNNADAKEAALVLQNEGFDVRAILSPTVPLGKERLRICLHTFNSDTEIINLINQLKIINHG